MKAYIEFNLPEEIDEFKMNIRGPDYWVVLWDLTQLLRSKLKYGHDYKTADEAIEGIQTELWEMIDGHGCPIDDIE